MKKKDMLRGSVCFGETKYRSWMVLFVQFYRSIYASTQQWPHSKILEFSADHGTREEFSVLFNHKPQPSLGFWYQENSS